jgi:hypothetical protein
MSLRPSSPPPSASSPPSTFSRGLDGEQHPPKRQRHLRVGTQLTPRRMSARHRYGVGAGRVAGTGAGGVIGCASAAGFASVSTEITGGPTKVA